MTYPFLKGLDLSELYYREAIRPILEASFPGLPHSAALLGPGSDVLGFDTPQSMDHDWGMRLMLFLSEADHPVYRERIDQALRAALPRQFHGYPVDMALRYSSRAEDQESAGDESRHCVLIPTVRGFFDKILHADPSGELRPAEWLTFSEQHLRSLTQGRVFHDGLGQLAPIRARLAYYPPDLWLYLLAAQWQRIGQEEHFMGRCGQAGDDLGSRLVAGRLVKDIMRLCFLIERQYAPYIKWFGTAFAQLPCAGDLLPELEGALEANTWQARETHLSAAYEMIAAMHNRLGVTPPLSIQVRPFFDRPFQVIDAGRFTEALRAAITDPRVLALPAHLGSVDQYVDSTDALNYSEQFRGMYQPVENSNPHK
jgi:hypothetical protein